MSNSTPLIIDVSSPAELGLLRQACLKFRRGGGEDQFAASPATIAFVALQDDEVVGWCWGFHLVRPDGGSMLYLHSIEVQEAHRCRGLGRALFDGFLAAGRKAGASKMFLFTAEANDAARRLYESRGGRPPDHGPTSVYWFRIR